MLNPKIILLDEPLEGLAPIIVEELLAALPRLIRDEGIRRFWWSRARKKILGVTDRAVILDCGMVVYASTSAALKADPAVLETYLGVTDLARAATRDTTCMGHAHRFQTLRSCI